MSGAPDPLSRRPRRLRRRRRSSLLPVLAVLLVAALAAYWYFVRERGELPALPPAAERAAPPPPVAIPPEPGEAEAELAPEPAPAEPEPLPSLDRSDALVREEVGRLSPHRALAAWLLSGDLLRRFVVAVDNVAEGSSPKRQLGMLAPKAPFRVTEREGRTYLDPRSYARYDVVAEVFASLDAMASARLYRRLEPLLEQAYRELGYPERRFDDTLRRALRRLLATPVVEGPVELNPRVLSYAYRDPELEARSQAEKQFMRMGPSNVRRVQAKLREIVRALEATASTQTAPAVSGPGAPAGARP